MIHSVDPVEDAKDDLDALKPFATDRQREYIDAILTYGGVQAAGRALGVSPSTISKAIKATRIKAALQGYSPEHDMDKPAPEMFFVKGVSTYYDKEGQKKGQWVKTSVDQDARFAALKEAILGLASEVPPAAAVKAPSLSDKDLLTVYPQGDPHTGLYAWEEETGAKFDLDEYERINTQAIDRLVQSAPSAHTALFIDLGDSTHADNNKKVTPGSGHILDVQGRHAEAIRLNLRVKRHQVCRLLEKHEKVVYRINPGNHDPETALVLAMLLEAYYAYEPRISVVTSPQHYWYHQHGEMLIGTCHGDGAKGKDLPLIMAADVPKMWGDSIYRVWHVGHVHHRDQKEYPGCDVEYHNTFAASDAWHRAKGYRSQRRMQAVTYHVNDGEIERQTCSLSRINRLVGT